MASTIENWNQTVLCRKWNNSNTLVLFQYKCCGAERFEDWKYSIWSKTNDTHHKIRSNVDRVVPDSCCISYSEMCGRSDHPSNIPYTGCIYRFIDDIRDHLNILGAIGFGFCFIQLFGLILSCCLYFRWFATKNLYYIIVCWWFILYVFQLYFINIIELIKAYISTDFFYQVLLHYEIQKTFDVKHFYLFKLLFNCWMVL